MMRNTFLASVPILACAAAHAHEVPGAPMHLHVETVSGLLAALIVAVVWLWPRGGKPPGQR
jgi:hypothetical protein